MGGGPAIRTAAKAVGVGVGNGSHRGSVFQAMPASAEQVIMKGISNPRSAATVSGSQSKVNEVTAVGRPTWEFDDWEFAGGEEDLVMAGHGGHEPIARVVFGGQPTLQEAKEATSELKEVIDQLLLPSAESALPDGPLPACQTPSLSLLTNFNYAEDKSSILYRTGGARVPKTAMRAFAMLSESPPAQSVVSSLASDPNVWNAVMRNEALMEYLESNKTNALVEDAESVKECDNESCTENTLDNTAESMASFKGFVENVKLKFVHFMGTASTFIKDLFRSTVMKAKDADVENERGMLFGLAVLVIVIVLLKRV